MRNLIVLALSAIALVGCSKTVRTIDQSTFYVVKAPETLYNCPQIGDISIPNPATATNKQVAEFMKSLIKNLKVCGMNMEAIKQYTAQAEKTIAESRSKK